MMKRIISFLSAAVITACMFSFTCFAKSDKLVLIMDDFDHLSAADEQQITEKATKIADKTGFNIIIVISDDIGASKSDSAVVSYADDIYDAKCGINTDGVLLLINNDTKYDYISTSGSAINYLSDHRISNILEGITPALKNENYAKAVYGFLSDVEGYYISGKANHQTEMLGREVDIEFGTIIGFAVFPFIIAIFVYAFNANMFKLSKATTSVYMVPNSLYLSQNTNTFVGVVTNRTYSPRSSGSSGGGGSHHSSTHHSSSGGRHGGGGHHR